MTEHEATKRDRSRRILWVRPNDVPPIETDDTILERKGVLAPMQPDAPPFLLLGEDRFVKGAFPLHPHEGIETVTFVVSGRLEHRDTEGNQAVVDAAGVQWMTAGKGIEHSEEPIGDEPVHAFQLWIDLEPKHKQIAPGLQMAQRDEQTVLRIHRGQLRIAAGEVNGTRGPIRSPGDATMAILEMEQDAEVDLDLNAAHGLLLFVRTGEAHVFDTKIAADHGAYLTPGHDPVKITARTSTQMLLYGAIPH